VPLHFFGCTSTISRFGERFRDGQYSLVSFLFAVLLRTVPPPRAQSFLKWEARAPMPCGVSAGESRDYLPNLLFSQTIFEFPGLFRLIRFLEKKLSATTYYREQCKSEPVPE